MIQNSMKKNNRKMTSKAANKPTKRNACKASFTTYNEKKNVEANRVGTLSKYSMKSHK